MCLRVKILTLTAIFAIAEGFVVPTSDDHKVPCVVTKGCDNVYHLSNEKGNYTKSVCLQKQRYDYDEAELQCQNKGMQLLTLSESNILSSLFKQAGSEIKTGSTLYIDSDSGDCSALKHSEKSFKVRNYSCSRTMMSFCEFKKENQLPSTTSAPITGTSTKRPSSTSTPMKVPPTNKPTTPFTTRKTTIYTKKPATTTRAPITTTPNNVVVKCDDSRHLRDSFGQYQTSICFQMRELNHKTASTQCELKGMKLLRLAPGIKSGVFDVIKQKFGAGTGSLLWTTQDNDQSTCEALINSQEGLAVSKLDCRVPIYSICEFKAPGSHPIHSERPGTDAKIDIEKCDEIEDILDANGKYLKSACLSKKESNHEEALAECQSYGMKLFYISPGTKAGLLAFAERYYGFGTGKVLWVAEDTAAKSCEVIVNFNGGFEVSTNYFCKAQVSFICEYGSSSQIYPPENFYEPDTTPAIGNPDCDETEDIFDTNGIYLKSACFQKTKTSHHEALLQCKSKKMKLFQVSTASRDGLLGFSHKLFGDGSGDALWITDESYLGQCNAIQNLNGTFSIQEFLCSSQHFSFCEFERSEQEI